MLTKLLLLIFCILNPDLTVAHEESPSCLYKSEICLGQSLDWIEDYTCTIEGESDDNTYVIFNSDYRRLKNVEDEEIVSRAIHLEFDKEKKLDNYIVRFICSNKPSMDDHTFFNSLFECIGYDQLFHYTQKDKSDYREYSGNYIFEDSTVEFEISDHPFCVFKIHVKKK